jgi:hypothetical protein
MLAKRLFFELIAMYGFRERSFLVLEGVRQVGQMWYSSSFTSEYAHYA